MRQSLDVSTSSEWEPAPPDPSAHSSCFGSPCCSCSNICGRTEGRPPWQIPLYTLPFWLISKTIVPRLERRSQWVTNAFMRSSLANCTTEPISQIIIIICRSSTESFARYLSFHQWVLKISTPMKNISLIMSLQFSCFPSPIWKKWMALWDCSPQPQ